MQKVSKQALLIVNAGSPEAATPEAVAPYLREFLSDRAIVDLPPWLWHPILRGIIIPRRKAVSAARYRRIWTDTGSPLIHHTHAVAQGLQGLLGEGWIVDCAMRYGRPLLQERIQSLLQRDVESIYLMPLFAQSASQTSGTIIQAAKEALLSKEKRTALRIVPPWFEASGYIRALSQRVRESVDDLGDTHLVMSFHGVPVKGAAEYRRQVETTAALLAEDLRIPHSRYSLTFQSKFGFGAWLKPSTAAAVEALAKSGCWDIAVVCPGFSVDCLETLEEVGEDLRGRFMRAGGIRFRYVPCLNAKEDAVLFYRDWVLGSAS